jgi:hypothetical protein
MVLGRCRLETDTRDTSFVGRFGPLCNDMHATEIDRRLIYIETQPCSILQTGYRCYIDRPVVVAVMLQIPFAWQTFKIKPLKV